MCKKYIFIILIVSFWIIISSCQYYDIIPENSNNFPQISPLPKDKLEVILYYPDKEMTRLVPEIRVVAHSSGKIEEIVIFELLKGTNKKELKNIIPKDIEILSLEVIDDIAYISFPSKLLNKDYEEKQEAFIIYSIVNTLTSIPSISKVQILIDGKAQEVLCKNYRIREPLEFNEVIVDKEYLSPISIINEYYNALLRQDYNKSMKMLDLRGIEHKKLNTLKIYLENELSGVEQFSIKDYKIRIYKNKIKMDMGIVFTYKGERQKSSYKKVELIPYNDKILIKGLVY